MNPLCNIDVCDEIDVLQQSDTMITQEHVRTVTDLLEGKLKVTADYMDKLENAWDKLHLAATDFHNQPLDPDIESEFRLAISEFNAICDKS